MASTRTDVILTSGVWTNLYTASGIPAGTALDVFNKGSAGVLLAAGATAPSDNYTGVPLYAGQNGNYGSYLYVGSGETAVWALSQSNNQRILVQETT